MNQAYHLKVNNHRVQDRIIILLALITFASVGCSTRVDPSTEKLTATENLTSPGSTETPYPQLVVIHTHADGSKTTETTSPIVPRTIDMAITKIDPTDLTSIAVHSDANTSLTINYSGEENESNGCMVAVWRRPETKLKDAAICVVRHSDPFDDPERLVPLLKSFLIDEQSLESSLNWTIQSRSSASIPAK